MNFHDRYATTRIGPRMRDAARYVKAHPGCTMYDAARAIAPDQLANTGYRPVARAVAVGLIRRERGRGVQRWALYPGDSA